MSGAKVAVGVAVVSVGAVLAAAAATDDPIGARPLRATVAPATDVQLICPGLDGLGGEPMTVTVADLGPAFGRAGGPPRVSATALTGDRRPEALTPDPAATLRFTSRAPAVVVRVRGPGAGAIAADQHGLVPRGPGRGALSTPCLPPTTDWWLTGADGRVGHDDELVLVNAGSTPADVTVTAWAATGRLVPPRLESFSVGAGSRAVLPVAAYTPDAAFVTFHVHANSGRVAAQVRTAQTAGLYPDGVDWLAPTLPPSRQVTVPGFARGPGPRLVVVTNPGPTDATVHLRVVTADRAFVPSGHPELPLPAGRSATVDLASTLGGAPGAVELTSDVPVTAAGMSQLDPDGGAGTYADLQWQPAATPLSGPAALADNSAPLDQAVRLSLAAPGAAGSVRVVTASGRSRTISVRADRTLSVDLVDLLGAAARGPLLLLPVSGRLTVSRSVSATGTHGPLVTAEQPWSLPVPASLPPVVQDPRAAVR